MKNYVSVTQFNERFGSDEKCLKYLFDQKTENQNQCSVCDKGFKYYPVKGRKCFECGFCGYQFYPMKDTIFEGSTTKLTLWFHVIYMFYTSRNGVSAKQIERVCNVSYKTAWRIGKLVRSLMSLENDPILTGLVEMDESYFGGRKPLNKKGKKGIGDKPVVFGMLQRKGRARLFFVKNRDKETLLPIISKSITTGSQIFSDGYAVYASLSSMGYRHEVIKHKRGHRFKEGVHTNGIESLWAYVKGPILGTHRSVSRKYLQTYLDEFTFRYNMNKTDDWLDIMLERL